MGGWAAWRDAGAREAFGKHRLFVRRGGQGRHLTLLHGFPTCSWDWSKIWDDLAAQRELLAVDLLGFGDSDKPPGAYTFGEQADLVEAVWAADGVRRTVLVAHDYSVTLALELLARTPDPAPRRVEIEAVVFLNGGLRGRLHRPRLIQHLLRSPLGPLLARMLDRDRFAKSFRAVFVTGPSDSDIDRFWTSVRTRDGHRRAPDLLQYTADRTAYADRWEGALDRVPVPFTFVWGLHDPVSGAHVLDSVRDLGTVHALDVGHYPQWEAPGPVRDTILAATETS